MAARARAEVEPAQVGRQRAAPWDVVLVGLTTLLAAQVVRVLFSLAYGFGERTSFVAAGIVALALSLSPLLAPLVTGLLGARAAHMAAIAAVVLARLAMQVVRPIPLWLAAGAAAVAFVAWALEFARVPGHRFVIGVGAGFAIDVALRSAFWSWDYAWQNGPAPLLLSLVVSGVTLVSSSHALRQAAIPVPTTRRALIALVVGSFLMLHFMVFQSPAFVASAAGVSLPVAALEILIHDALMLGAVLWVAARPPALPARLAAGIALVTLTLLFTTVGARPVIGAFAVAAPLSGALLALSLNSMTDDGGPASWWRGAAEFAGAMFVLLALTLLYQIHYDMPLPFPNSLLFQVAAAAVTLGSLRARLRRETNAWDRRALVLPLGLLVVPIFLVAVRADPAVRALEGRRFRFVNYNIHSSVNRDGQLDPEGIARVIEEERPDVVALQEVSRGWPIAGTADLAEWLSVRLGMDYVYAPAADGQFGNVVLTRLPIAEAEAVSLPFGAGPMRRSYARAELMVGGRTIDAISVHLQHREENTPTRLSQIALLFETWRRRRPAIVAGDLNAQPGSPEIAEFESRGLVSAQDATGHSDLPTSPSHAPRARIDWIFGTNDVQFARFARPLTTASDHLPLAVDVTVGFRSLGDALQDGSVVADAVGKRNDPDAVFPRERRVPRNVHEHHGRARAR
jgi:endonuclease/exonuclease/phosphatase family metal-dependent hydrolase